jgi:hypothetical protein
MRTKCIVGMIAVGTFACAANANHKWDGSDAARAWADATGVALHLDTEMPFVQGNLLNIRNRSTGEVIDTVVWVPTSTVAVGGDSWKDGNGTVVEGDISLVAGYIPVNGYPRAFAFASWTATAHSGALGGSETVVVPVRAFATPQDADEFIAEIADISTGKGSGDNGGIFCMDETWRGSNGEECCAYLAAYRDAKASCLAFWWMRLYACIPVALGAGGGTVKWCLETCVVIPPPANADCALACVGIGACVSIDSFILCMMGNDALYEACLRDARSQYILELANHGCELRKDSEDDQDIADISTGKVAQ